jgi:hypothetical protein
VSISYSTKWLVVMAIAALVGAGPALAAKPLSCDNGSASAINQYCQDLPASTGGRAGSSAGEAGPTVAGQLPRAILNRVQRYDRRLLTLPAKARVGPDKAAISSAAVGSSGTSDGSVVWPLLLVLALIAFFAIIIAARRRHRARAAAG